MSIDLTSPLSTPAASDGYNPIVPDRPTGVTDVPSVSMVAPIVDSLHAGTIDFTLPYLTGYDGCGINQYGVYGIESGTPKFLLAAEGFDLPNSWGLVRSGEFRVGDDIKEQSGTLIGDNWFRYLPETGMVVKGPMLRDISSDQNIIQSPGFDVQNEYSPTGSIAHSSTGGYADGPCYAVSGNGALDIYGLKTIDGAAFIRGAVFIYTDDDFDGTIVVRMERFSDDDESLGISNAVISYSGGWKRYKYVIKASSTLGTKFKFSIVVFNATLGTAKIDNWTAYRVFTTGIISTDFPDHAPIAEGIAIDRAGIRGYDRTLVKTLDFSAANGSAYLRGSLLVNGYAHTGTIFDTDGIETIDPLKVVYFSGCGLNEYASYGIKAELDGSGNHASSKAKYLLSAKAATWIDDYYWGTGFNQGEFRVGDDVGRSSATALRGDHYIWFDGIDNFRLKGVDITLSSGNYVWVGTPVSDGCGIGAAGVVGVVSDVPSFILAADDIADDGYWVSVGKGDLRVGGNTKTAAGSTLVLDASADTLTLNGNLYLTESGSYIRVGSGSNQNCGYVSENAIAFYGSVANNVNVLIGTSGHPWLDGTSLRIGDEVQGTGTAFPTAAQSSNFFGFDTTNGMVIRVNGYDVINTNTLDWSDMDSIPSVLDNTTGAYLGGTGTDWIHLGTNCYIDRTLYVGTSTNYIKLLGGSSPYMMSKSTASGVDEYAWKLDYLGHVYLNTVHGVGDIITINEKAIYINAIVSGSNGGYVTLTSTGANIAYNGGTGHTGQWYSGYSQIACRHEVEVEIGEAQSPLINIKSTTTGTINIGTDNSSILNLDGSYVRAGSGSGSLGFFGANGTTRQDLTWDSTTNPWYDSATTTAQVLSNTKALNQILSDFLAIVENMNLLNYTSN